MAVAKKKKDFSQVLGFDGKTSDGPEIDFARMKVRFPWMASPIEREKEYTLKCDRGVWKYRTERKTWAIFADGCNAEVIIREQMHITAAHEKWQNRLRLVKKK